ncbi:hypothetical protein [Skermanella sp. TT6]|uniref:hypothetical protein n=1 Tax=Skermanella cutis TaxID=2775420 RepID=UPI001FFE4724|nr:hypothetical protein [Skermanella sp. TT6]
MSVRFQIASLVFMMVDAVVFDFGAVLVPGIPVLAANAQIQVPVVVASVLVSTPCPG